MAKTGVNPYLKKCLTDNLLKLEEKFQSDVIFYYGEIDTSYTKIFRDFIEELKSNPKEGLPYDSNRLVFILSTRGGSVETVEKMVEIIRHHYSEIYFVVPDYAMSAGTILCMSGDKIYMDYSSSLGPIDPQIFSHKQNAYVPALGYLDKVTEILEKSRNNTVTPAELLWLQSQDLAMLRSCEQAKELSIKLLEERLVNYKFKNWDEHRTTAPIGRRVTQEEKEVRAKEVATILSDNGERSSHGRFINIDKLKKIVKIEIDDYTEDEDLSDLIREYNDLAVDFVLNYKLPLFLHSRYFI